MDELGELFNYMFILYTLKQNGAIQHQKCFPYDYEPKNHF